MEHCGIRVIEPELFGGYTPHCKKFMHEVVAEKDLAWLDVLDLEHANQFAAEMGEHATAVRTLESGQVQVRVLRGASLAVPRALRFDRAVAGQLPTGWYPLRLGIPKDIVDQVRGVPFKTLAT